MAVAADELEGGPVGLHFHPMTPNDVSWKEGVKQGGGGWNGGEGGG